MALLPAERRPLAPRRRFQQCCGMVRSLLAVSHCLPHPTLQRSFPEEFGPRFLLSSNLFSFQRIAASKCGAGTVRQTCNLSPICLTTSFQQEVQQNVNLQTVLLFVTVHGAHRVLTAHFPYPSISRVNC